MKKLGAIAVLLVVSLSGCVSSGVREAREAEAQAVIEAREANTKRFCDAAATLKKGMTMSEINAAGINTGVHFCPGGYGTTINLGHIAFEFDSECRLRSFTHKVDCS